MLRVLIVDDEALARQKLRQLLAAHAEVVIVGEAENVDAAHAAIEAEKPDLVFLDIRMPGGGGFALLKELKDPPQVVFVTAYSKHAVEAFAVDAADYLVKPVSSSRLTQALARVQGKLENPPVWQKTDRICFRTTERTVVAQTDAVIALKADGDFTWVYIEGESPLLICRKIGHYEQALPAPPFLRLDRSLMIHLGKVKHIEHTSLLLSGHEAPFELGRTAHHRLTVALAGAVLP